jgi:hypothetical protein
VDVAHSTTAGGKKSFYRLNSMGEVNQLPNNPGSQIVIMQSFNGRAVSEYDPNFMQQTLVLRFAKYLGTNTGGNFETEIDTCMNDCYLVMMDFISRMKHDYEADTCAWLKRVDFSGLFWSEFAGPVLDRHYGWDLTIPFIASFPAYRSAKWTS